MLRVALPASLLVLALALTAVNCQPAKDDASRSTVKPDVLKKIQAALPESAPATPKKPRKLLLFSKTNGFRHGSIPVGAAAITQLGSKTGAFTAVHSEDDALFEPEKLKEFDAVFMLNTTGEIFRPKNMPKDPDERKAAQQREQRLKESLIDFVKGGKGLAGVHSATDTYQNWGAYNAMMGGAFVSHPWSKKVPVKNLSQDHPLNQPFGGKDFEINDEIYMFRDDTALPTDRKMLLSLDTGRMDAADVARGKRKDGQYAISWVSTYGAGRTFYCSLGHRDEIFCTPAILKHYLAGIQYVLGDLDADAAPTAQKQ